MTLVVSVTEQYGKDLVTTQSLNSMPAPSFPAFDSGLVPAPPASPMPIPPHRAVFQLVRNST